MPKGAIVQKCKKNKQKMCTGLGYCKKNLNQDVAVS